MTKVLVSDPIDQAGIDILSQVAQVDQRTGLSEEELVGIIGDYDGLMIRSGTQVTAAVIAAASRLKIIGRAGVRRGQRGCACGNPEGRFGGELPGGQHDRCSRARSGDDAVVVASYPSGPRGHAGRQMGP